MVKTIVKVDGMMCSMCEAHINDAIRRSFNVKKVKSNRKKKETVIESEAPLDPEKIRDTIEKTGYIYLGIVSPASEEMKRTAFEDGSDPTGYVQFEQRNKFCVGDEIEIMKPDGRNIPATVLEFRDSCGTLQESAPHSRQQLLLRLSRLPENGDLLRMKAQEDVPDLPD